MARLVRALSVACLIGLGSPASAQEMPPPAKKSPGTAKAPLSAKTSPRTPAAPPGCVDKAGQATAITRGFAEYEAFLIIRQVTGNWPVQSDRISAPTYMCKPAGAMWSCVAKARVCKVSS